MYFLLDSCHSILQQPTLFKFTFLCFLYSFCLFFALCYFIVCRCTPHCVTLLHLKSFLSNWCSFNECAGLRFLQPKRKDIAWNHSQLEPCIFCNTQFFAIQIVINVTIQFSQIVLYFCVTFKYLNSSVLLLFLLDCTLYFVKKVVFVL